jgi:hypothetical protein
MSNLIKKIDAFGSTLNLKFKSEDKFNTTIGGLLSLILYTILSVYSIKSIKQLVLQENPNVSSQFVFRNESLNIDYTADELRFGLAFTFVVMQKNTYKL